MTNPQSPPLLHIVGRKNAGKTTLVCDLVGAFTERGYRVATIKHTHHRHELDTPGKDSHRHRTSGAVGVGILSPGISAVFLPQPPGDDQTDRYSELIAALPPVDLILVEGDLSTTHLKIEVWRAGLSEQPYANQADDIWAIVTDDDVQGNTQLLPRRNISELVHALSSLLKLPAPSA